MVLLDETQVIGLVTTLLKTVVAFGGLGFIILVVMLLRYSYKKQFKDD